MGHPFLQHLVNNLQGSDQWYGLPYLTIMFSTGPGYVTAALSTFEGDLGGIGILAPHLYSGASSLFIHKHGGTWHTLDGKLIWKAFEFRYVLALVVVFVTLCSCICCQPK